MSSVYTWKSLQNPLLAMHTVVDSKCEERHLQGHDLQLSQVFPWCFKNQVIILADLVLRAAVLNLINSARYFGARLFIHLWVNIMILYSILHDIGNQWSCFKTGVMWLWLFAPVKILAAEFWIFCNFSNSCFGKPYKRELLQSNLDVTKAWMTCSSASFIFCELGGYYTSNT